MTVLTESHISPRTVAEKPRARPVRMLRWFIIVGLLLALLVGALVGFNTFRNAKIAEFFANMKPPPTPVSVAEAKSEVIPKSAILPPCIRSTSPPTSAGASPTSCSPPVLP
jgi:membrane fusion protein, multidrug efflux system